jgi:hypothetical protein
MAAIVIGQIPKYEDTRVVHLDNGGDSFSRTDPEHRHVNRMRHRIPVCRHDVESVSGQCEAADLARTPI